MTLGPYVLFFWNASAAQAFAREIVQQDRSVLQQLDAVTMQLDLVLQKQGELKMALSAAEQALIERFNVATNAIAAKIQQLIDNPPADDAEFNSVLQGIATGLEALGAPGSPLPPPPTPVP